MGIRCILLIFGLNTHHRVNFRLIISLAILLRILNTLRDYIGVLGAVSLGAEATLLLLLLLLGFCLLYDVNLLLKGIDLILKSHLLRLLFLVVRHVLLLNVVYVLTFENIFRTQVVRDLRVVLGILLRVPTVDPARTVR